MPAGSTFENCTNPSDSCQLNEHTSHHCHDCDGLGSVGALPCGRCAGSGEEPTCVIAAGVHEGVRVDFVGALWNWRSREWLRGVLPLGTVRRRESP